MNQKAVDALKQLGYIFESRRKKIHVNYLEYEVITFLIRQGDNRKIKIMPDMVSPHRPYPLFAYIFAVAVYELTPNITQRCAAKITRDCFGLGSGQFSASALCRARKKLKDSAAEMAETVKELADHRHHDENEHENDQVMIVLNQTDNQGEEYITSADSAHIKDDKHCKYEASAQAVMPGEVNPGLEEIFSECPLIAEFVRRHSSGKPVSLKEKAGFSAYIGQLNRKFFLLNRHLLI